MSLSRHLASVASLASAAAVRANQPAVARAAVSAAVAAARRFSSTPAPQSGEARRLVRVGDDWDPFVQMERRMNDLFPLFRSPFFESPSFRSIAPARGLNDGGFSIDLTESEKEYVVRADVPGVKKDDISVTLKDDVLTISGERASVTEEKDDQKHIMERSFGRFTRAIQLPKDANADEIAASVEDGVLKLTIAKRPVAPDEGLKKIPIALGNAGPSGLPDHQAAAAATAAAATTTVLDLGASTTADSREHALPERFSAPASTFANGGGGGDDEAAAGSKRASILKGVPYEAATNVAGNEATFAIEEAEGSEYIGDDDDVEADTEAAAEEEEEAARTSHKRGSWRMAVLFSLGLVFAAGLVVISGFASWVNDTAKRAELISAPPGSSSSTFPVSSSGVVNPNCGSHANDSVLLVYLRYSLVSPEASQMTLLLSAVPCGDFVEYDLVQKRFNLAVPVNITLDSSLFSYAAHTPMPDTQTVLTFASGDVNNFPFEVFETNYLRLAASSGSRAANSSSGSSMVGVEVHLTVSSQNFTTTVDEFADVSADATGSLVSIKLTIMRSFSTK
ncbi:hypothetical protein HK405_001665, partial [Cladochytrium tenue]